jgi:hypothetical protein
MSDYQRRKSLRIKLNNKRNADKDHTGARYTRDAKVLNRAMRMYKIEGPQASW